VVIEKTAYGGIAEKSGGGGAKAILSVVRPVGAIKKDTLKSPGFGGRQFPFKYLFGLKRWPMIEESPFLSCADRLLKVTSTAHVQRLIIALC